MGKRGPAPKGEYSSQTAVLSTRITPELRARLEAEVKKSRKTLSREIEHRLRRSFIEDDKISEAFGSRQNYALMRMISMLIETIHFPAYSVKDWREDPDQYDQVIKKINGVFEALRPPGKARELTEYEKTIADASYSQAPLVLISNLQSVDAAIPLSAPRRLQIASLLKGDLGEMIERPKLFFGNADQIRERIEQLEQEEAKRTPEDDVGQAEK